MALVVIILLVLLRAGAPGAPHAPPPLAGRTNRSNSHKCAKARGRQKLKSSTYFNVNKEDTHRNVAQKSTSSIKYFHSFKKRCGGNAYIPFLYAGHLFHILFYLC